MKGITLQNSQSYHLTFTRSSDVEANYLRVTSPEHSVDTKGIHLVDSYNVHVMDNLISTGICNLPTLHPPCFIQVQQNEVGFQKTISQQCMHVPEKKCMLH